MPLKCNYIYCTGEPWQSLPGMQRAGSRDTESLRPLLPAAALTACLFGIVFCEPLLSLLLGSSSLLEVVKHVVSLQRNVSTMQFPLELRRLLSNCLHNMMYVSKESRAFNSSGWWLDRKRLKGRTHFSEKRKMTYIFLILNQCMGPE